MRTIKFNLLFSTTCIIIVRIIFITSCEKQTKETTSQIPPQKEEKTTVEPKEKVEEVKPPLTFEEFAQNFIRDSKISEGNFLKYCDDFVNGKDSYYAYKTFKVVQNYIPVYKKVILHLQSEMDRSNGVPP